MGFVWSDTYHFPGDPWGGAGLRWGVEMFDVGPEVQRVFSQFCNSQVQKAKQEGYMAMWKKLGYEEERT